MARTSTQYIADNLMVPVESVNKLGVYYSVMTPRGMAIKLEGIAIFSIIKNGKECFYTCNDKSHGNIFECSAQKAQVYIHLASLQRSNPISFPEIAVPNTPGWISIDFIKENNWELYNAFCVCEFVLGYSGSYSGLNGATVHFEAGKPVIIPLAFFRPSMDMVAYIRYEEQIN